MKSLKVKFALVLLVSFFAIRGYGQGTPAAALNPVVPPVIQFSSIANDADGNSLNGIVNIRFSLYASSQGGEPLWTETQNVQLDSTGHYSVQLGITKPTGVPTALFTEGQAHWLGVEIAGQGEQPRVYLVSVPYALKAGDAATVGGLPPSAFVLAAPPNASSTTVSQTPNTSSATSLNPGGTGTTDFIPMWTDSTGDLGNSAMFQSGTSPTAKIGINTTTPASTLDVKGGATIRGALSTQGTLSLPATGTATATGGKNSQPQTLAASSFNSSTSKAVTQTFQWQAEPTGNDTSTPSGTLNLLFGSGTNKPTETRLNIASNGQITFAPGQSFPGTGNGTVTEVATGTGLTGGPITGSGTLNIATGGVINAMLANPSLTVAPGTALTGGGVVSLGGSTTLNLDTTQVPLLAAANTFTGNQTVNGNLSSTGMVTGSGFQIGSNLFGYGSYANANASLGFAGNTTMTGIGNTASGVLALFSNTSGNFNAASGAYALQANTTGYYNTASGGLALDSNTTGAYNTATGGLALSFNTSGANNTASGGSALYNNSTGNSNTASGTGALLLNTTGNLNTASGSYSGYSVDNSSITGSSNTFVGANTAPSTGTLNNATAIGANAEVAESNAMVLGSINGVNGATASTNVGIGTTTPAATLDVHGTGNFTGLITFASGQTFPGTGTITGVTPGTDLTGGGGSGNVTLNVDTTKVLTGVVAGTDLTGGGTGGVQTLNLDTTKVPLLAAANNFTASQTVSGNLTATGVVSGSSYQIGSNLFAYGSYGNVNAFLGFAGNTTMTGGGNTASGVGALFSNTTGFNSTANGFEALYSNSSGVANTANGAGALETNSTGFSNTASGVNALFSNTIGDDNTANGVNSLDSNTTGSYNTASGFSALFSNATGTGNLADGYQALYWATGNNNTGLGTYAGNPLVGNPTYGSSNTYVGYLSNSGSYLTLNNATAIGANAQVTASNAMVLGSINGVNSAAASTLVGIGTTAPTYLLHVGNQGGTTYNNFLRVEGPASGSGNAISVGGNGDVAVDAPGVPAGRFVVKTSGLVGIGVPNPLGNPFQIKQGMGNALADGWATYSSRRWKTNIHLLPDALSKVKRLRGVSYDLKSSGKHEIGVIAEEVGEVIPEVVSYEENGKDARGVDYSRLTALLIEAVKQQQEQIASLRLELRQQALKHARLESRLAQLEGDRGGHSRLASAKPLRIQPAH